MWRVLVLMLALVLSPLHSFRAEADCSVAPNQALLTHTVNASGIEFSVTPADSGCPATKLSYAFVYLDQATNAWEKWSAWIVGSATGKAFKFKVPTIQGKTRVTVGIEASNKWGTAAFTPYGVSFQPADAETVNTSPGTVISALIKDLGGTNRSMKFEISHPDSGVCSNYGGSRYYNCSIPMKYRITSEDSKSWFYGNGQVYTEAGEDVGYFGSSTFTGYADSQWRSGTIEVRMPMTGKVYLSFTGAGNNESYKPLSRTVISLFVKTAEQVKAEEAAAKKVVADEEAAKKRAEEQRQAAKKLTIICKKGKASKKVTGESPICPKGYINPMARYATFQAFSLCQLYKKDSTIAGARLGDNGRTLTLDNVGNYNWSILYLSQSDYECAARVLKMPDFVKTSVAITRALDGMQRATWGKISAYWTYHPDDGINISFNSK